MKKQLSLVQKLCRIMRKVDSVIARGHNDTDDYDFVQEKDVLDVLRLHFAKYDVLLLPRVLETRRYPVTRAIRGGQIDSFVTELRVEWTFIDGETDQRLVAVVEGAGEDQMDKGVYKALTGSLKYVLMKPLMLSSGEDPEKTSKSLASATREAKTEAAQNVAKEKLAGTFTPEERPRFPLHCTPDSDVQDSYLISGPDATLAAARESLMFHGAFVSRLKSYRITRAKMEDLLYALNQLHIPITRSAIGEAANS